VRKRRRALPMTPGRTLALGLDGCSWTLLEPLLAGGELPRLAELRERSARARLDGVAPASPTPAWVSFATGSTPAAHGVLDARQNRGGDGFGPACQDDLRRSSYYLQLGREGRSTVVVNLPLDHSGCEGGLIVNDGLSPDARRILPVGRRAKYLRLLETYPERPADPADADELCRLAQARFDLARELFLGESWDHFFLLFSEPRWLARASAGAFAAGDATAYEGFARLLRLIDGQLGWFVDHAGDALVAVLSAYGHRPESHVLRPEALLAELGLGEPAAASERARAESVVRPRRDGIVRFAPFGRRRGSAPPAPTEPLEREAPSAFVVSETALAVHVRDEAVDVERIRAALLSLELDDGTPALADVWRFHELAGRKPLPGEPALVFAPASGVAVATGQGAVVERTESGAGARDPEGLLLLAGPGVAPAELDRVSVCDVAPTLLWAAGAGIPSDMEGRVLFEAFELSFAAGRPLREVESAPRDSDPVDHVATRLRALGYL
jgi:hypothetical protein